MEVPRNSCLREDQWEMLKEIKIQLQIDNEKYLRRHPEIKHMLGHFIRVILEVKPEDVKEYASKHFRDERLRQTVEEEQQRIEEALPVNVNKMMRF
eukprot:Nk52_evm80s226 gene=Nk52_evmTU80s226